jgi:hypothetical protein
MPTTFYYAFNDVYDWRRQETVRSAGNSQGPPTALVNTARDELLRLSCTCVCLGEGPQAFWRRRRDDGTSDSANAVGDNGCVSLHIVVACRIEDLAHGANVAFSEEREYVVLEACQLCLERNFEDAVERAVGETVPNANSDDSVYPFALRRGNLEDRSHAEVIAAEVDGLASIQIFECVGRADAQAGIRHHDQCAVGRLEQGRVKLNRYAMHIVFTTLLCIRFRVSPR